MQRLDSIAVHHVPAFYQHAYDRILYLRSPEDTPTRALKAIGLFNIITSHLSREPQPSLSAIAKEIGMTYQGLLKTVRYLERLELVEVNKLSVARPFIRDRRQTVRRLEEVAKIWPLPLPFENARQLSHKDAPVVWQLAYGTLLDQRGPEDTAAKALKCMGLLNVISRLAAQNVVVTKTILAARLEMAPHALTSHIEYLHRHDLVAITEQRARSCNAREYRIEIPEPVAEHVNLSLRQLERHLKRPGWEDAALLHRRAREIRH